MIIHDCKQGTDAWFALRVGIPTGSNASKLVTGTGKASTSMAEYAQSLAADKYAGKPVDAWEGNGYTQRGTELEPDASSTYEFTKGVDIQEVGFITGDEEQFGVSPNGLAPSRPFGSGWR